MARLIELEVPEEFRGLVEQLDLRAQAADRVKAGTKWLDENAPAGWRLDMIDIMNGKVTSQVHFNYGTHDPLGLAFRRHPSIYSWDQRSDHVAAHRLFFSFFPKMKPEDVQQKLIDFGFHTKSIKFEDTVIVPDSVDAINLDEAWEQFLCNMRWNEFATKHASAA